MGLSWNAIQVSYTPIWPEMTLGQVSLHTNGTAIETMEVPDLILGCLSIEPSWGVWRFWLGGSIDRPPAPPPYTESLTTLFNIQSATLHL